MIGARRLRARSSRRRETETRVEIRVETRVGKATEAGVVIHAADRRRHLTRRSGRHPRIHPASKTDTRSGREIQSATATETRIADVTGNGPTYRSEADAIDPSRRSDTSVRD